MTKTLTYGLTHIAMGVKDTAKTLLFYQTVFDMEPMYHEKGFLQLSTPGCNDILVFEESGQTGNAGGIAHYGFRLRTPEDIGEISRRVEKAGGIITERGEFIPGSPYIFFKDPDGYEVEVWYEVIP